MKDGQILRLDVTGSNVEIGGSRYLLGAFRDATPRRAGEQALHAQLEELQRWQELNLGREDRIIELKREINELLARLDQPARYENPVAAGMVTNLARPGGMITGLADFNIEISGKRVELLLSAAPKVKLVGFLTSSAGPVLDRLMEVARHAAAHYGVDSRFAVVTRPEEIDPVDKVIE